jgi:chromosome segregation ATPase
MKVALLGSVAIAVFLGLNYVAYTTLQNKLNAATEVIADLETDLELAQIAAQNLEQSVEELQTITAELNSGFAEIRQNSDRIDRILQTHDLNRLAYQRPELVESIINNASEAALRCLELLSGAPLNANEREATSAQDFNSECPWLYDAIRMQ